MAVILIGASFLLLASSWHGDVASRWYENGQLCTEYADSTVTCEILP